MRMKKFVVGLLVLGLAVSVLGMIGFAKKGDGQGASASVDNAVIWTMQKFIELTIDVSSFDFGTIGAGVDTVTAEDANKLYIYSNTEWTLSFSKSGDGSDHLAVDLSAGGGSDNGTIIVDYTLSNLRSMDPGDYTVTVTYTVTAK